MLLLSFVVGLRRYSVIETSVYQIIVEMTAIIVGS